VSGRDRHRQGRVQEIKRQEADKGTEDCCCLLKTNDYAQIPLVR
jgi:hypothetical protein